MRFALLIHDHPRLHWDLLLEAGAACRTWRLLLPPDTPGEIPVERLPDHRRLYLDYEGPVSGGRGSVTQWDAGGLVWLTARPQRVRCELSGRIWQGCVEIDQADQPSGGTLRFLPRLPG